MPDGGLVVRPSGNWRGLPAMATGHPQKNDGPRLSLVARCDDDAMLRAVAVSVALSVLTSACALVEQPPPPGTRVIEAEVRNLSHDRLSCWSRPPRPKARFPVRYAPSSVPPGATARVTIYVPTAGEWSILIDPTSSMNHEDFDRFMAQGCTMILIETDGAYGSASCE